MESLAVKPGFDVFSRRVQLGGVLTTTTGLHIGSGAAPAVASVDKVVTRDRRDTPFVPGSSLKGVIRAAVCSVLRGFERHDTDVSGFPCRRWSCADDLSDDVGASLVGAGVCFHRHMLEFDDSYTKEVREHVRQFRLAMLPKDHPPNEPPKPGQLEETALRVTCPTCQVFGSPFLAAKVRFSDAYLTETEEWLGTEIRDGVGIDRGSRTAKAGIKYDFEAVPAGTSFGFDVTIENPTPAEIGIVLFGFELLHQGMTRLGGIKSRGLGRVIVKWLSVEDWDPASVFSGVPVQRLAVPPGGDDKVEQAIKAWVADMRDPLITAVTGSK